MSKLSNPFSTGGGGLHFEAQVQASFVALMLTGGFAPSLPCWPISEIKLQGKIDGYDTDDLIVYVKNTDLKEQRKLIGQVKHAISVTKRDAVFGEVIQSAWNDFNNPDTFSQGKDVIALITGPLNGVDAKNVPWLLNQARHTKNVDEFLRNVKQANFSPSKSVEKLEAIKHHLKVANGGTDVREADLYSFLRHFHLLGYDLGGEAGVIISLLHSHISQFHPQYPHWLWSRLVDIVQSWNQDAGTITHNNLPEDVIDAFKQKVVTEVPKRLRASREIRESNWGQHPDASYIALAMLIGSWNDKQECDVRALTTLLGLEYDEWIQKAREILHQPGSPLSLKNGVWNVLNRSELWRQLGSRILDQNLNIFKELAVSILKESDPAFELPSDERYAARVHGKVPNWSPAIRQGVAEGLAILGALPEYCTNCSQRNAEITAVLAIREIFDGADWRLWGSLNNLLPSLAEAAPREFLEAVQRALRLEPSPFDELFAQEGNGFNGSNYMTGLLWALEGLAWEEQFLVPVCDLLAELASHDPGGQWANRPGNSLTDILLPWMPHTLASIEKRKVAVQTVLSEWPDVGWNLLLSLLPNQHQTTSGTHKPKWREAIPDDWEKGVTTNEYWQQASTYAELVVSAAGQDVEKLSDLIDRFDSLTKPAFDQFIETLSSDAIKSLPEEQKQSLWRRLSKFTKKHRRHADAKWALPNELIAPIEVAMEGLAPTDPFLLYAELFSGRDFDLYEESGNWKEQRIKLDERRTSVVQKITEQYGIDGAIRFAESVTSSRDVGAALAAIATPEIEKTLLPDFLDSENEKHLDVVSAFIWRRRHDEGWAWCDRLNRAEWNHRQIGQFLACLPFTRDAWERAGQWLGKHEGQYWNRASAFPYEAEEDLGYAIDKLLEYGRPHAAINCLERMLHSKNTIDPSQCVRALLGALKSSEPNHAMDSYHMVELIKHLQSDSSVSDDDLFRVEWAYLPLLNQLDGNKPVFLHRKLANEPDFFCEVIQLIYRSNKERDKTEEPSEEQKAIATNAYRLLREWTRPPGLRDDGTFDSEHFKGWLQRVREVCIETGHLEVALINIGEALIYSPADEDGLWINKTVAGALNDRYSEEMRDGFRTALYNSRGVHTVDPSGKPEMDLAEKYGKKAEDAENAGFHRLAVTLRGLSESYIREAERVRSDFGKDENE